MNDFIILTQSPLPPSLLTNGRGRDSFYFVLTLLWDQQLWLAAIAFPVGFVAALYALWLSISLQRFYATTANANASATVTEGVKPTSS